MKVLCVVGARPNFMKVAPVVAALREAGHVAVLVHTGQHYDEEMSQVFFDELMMPRPEVNLAVGSASHAVQTARVMERFEPVVIDQKPDWVLVAGDVNSTIACAIVAAKLGVRVAHLEAGLRSFDRRMPEEINRVLTDSISDLLLTPSSDADDNLLREGVDSTRIVLVGNAMIDSLVAHRPRAAALDIRARLGLGAAPYAAVTLHRPSNVDSLEALERSIDILLAVSERLSVVIPLHPRTRKRMVDVGLLEKLGNRKGCHVIEPLGYLEFLALQASAALILTDSGGIQEEATALGVPCLTMRTNTERPVTIEQGTNALVGHDKQKILAAVDAILGGRGKAGKIPAYWDGRTAERVVAALEIATLR